MGRLERANSFVGRRDDPNTGDSSCAGKPREGLVAIVDPFSTGAHLAAQAAKLGYGVIRVFSVWDSPVAALIQEGVTVDFFATVQFNDQAPDLNEATNQCVRDLQSLPQRVIAVLPGAETGVELAESLAHRMGLRGNGENGSFARYAALLRVATATTLKFALHIQGEISMRWARRFVNLVQEPSNSACAAL